MAQEDGKDKMSFVAWNTLHRRVITIEELQHNLTNGHPSLFECFYNE